MTIRHLKIVSVPVKAQEAGKRFYQETLGFDLLTDQQFMPAGRWVELAPPGAQTAITLVTWFEAMKRGGDKSPYYEPGGFVVAQFIAPCWRGGD